jgi:Protein of unknown function (DUF1559)
MNDQQTTPAKRSPRPRFQFDLTTLLLMPVFLAALGAIGAWVAWELAAALAPIPIGFLLARSRLLTWGDAASIAVILGILIALLLPANRSVNTSSWRRHECSSNLKQIMLALHTYHDAYGSFPPAYVADEDGQPMHSWRVLILPFLGHQRLYEDYDFSQPWDSPNNSNVAVPIPDYFYCPADTTKRATDTSYVLITGDGSAWPDDHAPGRDDFTDDPAQTIVLVEVVNSGIHWMEPRDLPMSEALQGINAKTGLGISSRHRGGVQVGRADGSIRFIPESVSRQQLQAMLTPDGGEAAVGQ